MNAQNPHPTAYAVFFWMDPLVSQLDGSIIREGAWVCGNTFINFPNGREEAERAGRDFVNANGEGCPYRVIATCPSEAIRLDGRRVTQREMDLMDGLEEAA